MDHNMFCFQCEQTAGCSGCTGKTGVCGKNTDVAKLQDELTGALIGLARASDAEPETMQDPAPSQTDASASRAGAHGPVPPGAPTVRLPAAPPARFRWYPRLTRASDGSVVGGVCAGLAAYAGLDATVIRIIFVLLTVFSGGSWVLVYILLMLLVPPARSEE